MQLRKPSPDKPRPIEFGKVGFIDRPVPSWLLDGDMNDKVFSSQDGKGAILRPCKRASTTTTAQSICDLTLFQGTLKSVS